VCRLAVQIGGWDYPPEISDGIISDGAWGNVPPGEVYVVPQGGEGVVAVNGSLPGRVLASGEELTLVFRAGWLHEMRPKIGPAVRHLQETQISHAQGRGDREWSNLAEIGFGLNPAVHELTGVPLVDGKKANTLHVALGHSACLGGNVDSVIHCAWSWKDRPCGWMGVCCWSRSVAGERAGLAGSPDRAPPEGWWDPAGAMHAAYRAKCRCSHAVPACDPVRCEVPSRWKSTGDAGIASPWGPAHRALAARLYDSCRMTASRSPSGADCRRRGIGLGRHPPWPTVIMRQYDVVRFVESD
jgi:hypothetical protein